MLITKSNPVGIDVPIQKLQTYLHTRLLPIWGIDSDQWSCYGRCYRNRTSKGYQAEVYDGREVTDVYFDDTKTVVSFFGISDRIDVNAFNEANIHLVFFANLEKLKPAIAHRADEEVRKDVQDQIGAGRFGFQIDSIELWLERCLREYDASIARNKSAGDGSLKYVDMQPTHVFRINLKSQYNINNC